jgi:two-component system, LytTR family, sensor kinase
MGVGLARQWRRRPHGRAASIDGHQLAELLAAINEHAETFGDALTAHGAERAAVTLRRLLAIDGIAICDTDRVLGACRGLVDVRDLFTTAAPVLSTARPHVATLPWTDASMQREAVSVPLVVDGVVAGALTGIVDHATDTTLHLLTEAARLVAREVELAELAATRARLAGAQLAALRAQMSPHFLYNALTAIATLVPTDPEQASDLVLRFARFTRYRLSDHAALVPLATELEATDTYLALERARFGDRLRVRIEIAPETLGVAVPSLTIQPLVENALRHGLERRAGPAHLSIRAVDDGADVTILVDDDGIGADASVVEDHLNNGSCEDHVGLGNVDERMRMAFGPGYGLVVETAPGAGMRVTVRVPKAHVRFGTS